MTTYPVTNKPQTIEGMVDKETVFDLTSGYADEIYFQIIKGSQQQVLALQAGEIDMIGQFVDPDLRIPLMTDPNILINQTIRRGFGLVSFNCEKTPTNWTSLRQAFAYALDKDELQLQALGGFSRPIDSPIPTSMGAWSLDNHPDFVTNYYEPDPVTGNAILDAAGFVDIDSDGWREDPNGNPINFSIVGANVNSTVIETVITFSINAFNSLHIKTYPDLIDFNTLLLNIDNDDFNAVFMAFSLGGTDPLFLENFQSDAIANDWNFYNSTYDDLIDTMLKSGNETEVYEACWTAQRILWEEQPLCVIYQNLLISAYRKDPWEGFVNTEGEGVFDTWSFLKVQLKEDYGSGEDYNSYKQGGRFTVSLPEQMESTNILNSNSMYTHMPLDLVYDTLYKQNPYTHEDCAWLARDWLIEEVDPFNKTSIPSAMEGDLMKVTYYLQDELTWHDGVPLTSSDVAFSYELINSSNSPVYFSAVKDISHVETPNVTTVEIFTSSSSIFTLHKISIPIFPQHIWNSVENPLTWDNPEPIGSGPYKWKERVAGDHITLERNDNFYYNPRNYMEEIPMTTTPSSTQESTTITTASSITTTDYTTSQTESLSLIGISLLQNATVLVIVISASFLAGSLIGKGFTRFKR